MASVEQSLPLAAAGAPVPGLTQLARAATRVLTRSYVIAVFLALWELVPRLHLVEPAFLPPLSEVLGSGWSLLRSGELLLHVRASLARSLVGFSLAILSAVPLGLLIGWYKGVANTLNPLLEALRNTAALALLPVFI